MKVYLNSKVPRTVHDHAFVFLLNRPMHVVGDGLFHVKHQAPFEKDYIYIHILTDGITAEFIFKLQTLRQLVAVNRSALTLVVSKEQKPLSPPRPQRLVDSLAGLLAGCRYGQLQLGIQQGLRPCD